MGLEELLQFGAIFDWISPTLAIAQTASNGGGHTFRISLCHGYSGGDIDAVLRRANIPTWGKMIVSGHIMITVKKEHKGLAILVLQKAGMPTS